METISVFLSSLIKSSGGLSFVSPLKLITSPLADAIVQVLRYNATISIVVALAMLFLALRYMVIYMKALIMGRAELIFDKTFFKTPYHGFVFGMILTALIQSSSVTTSLMVPLAGAGLVTLEQLTPYAMGANIGTTITAFLAAFSIGNSVAVSVAFAHLMFNLSGVAIFWWIRFVPIKTARIIAHVTKINRGFAILYVLLMFFLIPMSLIFLLD